MELIGENEIKLIARVISDHVAEVVDKQLRENLKKYAKKEEQERG